MTVCMLASTCLFRASHDWKTLKALSCSAVRPPSLISPHLLFLPFYTWP
ncbi:hypothetical protein CGRA01v4_14688 [Colletotrichum graminicola]|nr:hypothetical protein CGRA01v4_14688 [Colletotrichum graminicola]